MQCRVCNNEIVDGSHYYCAFKELVLDTNENSFNDLFTVIRPNGSKSVNSLTDNTPPLMAGDATLSHSVDYLDYVPTEKTEEVVD